VPDAVDTVCVRTIPHGAKGLAIAFTQAIRGTDGPSDQKNNTSAAGIAAFRCRQRGVSARLAQPYIRSIMALPNPEHETCVDPGMSRAKS
jgi:hypothetical protein